MQLHHGDCLAILPSIPDRSVDAVICDPPYGTTACKWDSVIPFEPMWKELKRIIKPRGAIVLFGSQPFTSALVMSNPKWFRYDLVWEKTRATSFAQPLLAPLRAHESILLFYKTATNYNPQMQLGASYTISARAGRHVAGNIIDGRSNLNFKGKTNTGRYPRSVIQIPNSSAEMGLHPTQKPLALLEYLIKTYTNPGDTVLDFTFGSGTTGVACVNLDRDFIGIEKDDHYFTIGSDRIHTALATPRQQSILD
jgi:DNA modification methylase